MLSDDPSIGGNSFCILKSQRRYPRTQTTSSYWFGDSSVFCRYKVGLMVSLFVSQRLHWMNVRGTPCGQPGRRCRDSAHQEPNPNERDCICRSHAEKLVGEDVGNSQRRSCAKIGRAHV